MLKLFSWCPSFLKLTLVTTALLLAETSLGMIPNQLATRGLLQNSSIAQAQNNYDEEKLNSYAAAVLEIEPIREEVKRKIQAELDGQPMPQMACHRSESYQDLPEEARSLIINYCQRSEEIVENQGLSVSEFNEITQEIQNNPELRQRVQDKMLELQ
ncbi:DUF4168 domain-containing protein [Euhalothece natronophila Z-M001]|uniref:DUF4168 domain-containing protein n=1 Tax=Euhalothece natronophila Z-M001 TaxID=522448 RepID=A0A5B8NJ05_9CHRO|nr:DUF4168 domain-containing protein [Euhalothece natronophila]QDZ38956.1 DUF4168 domain-containing protein [Euhalothece natronophila Z-M001]